MYQNWPTDAAKASYLMQKNNIDSQLADLKKEAY